MYDYDVKYMSTFTPDVIQYYKGHMHNARKVGSQQLMRKSILYNVWHTSFGEKYEQWLVSLFDLQSIDDLITFINYASLDYVISKGG